VRIVVGHHRTPEGQAALDRAVELARQPGGELHLVGLVPLPHNDDEVRAYERSRAEREKELEKVAETFRDDGLTCQVHVPNGVRRPADAILSVARIEGADLIVIGMRRRSRVGKLVLGSTAQEVLLDAECDVLSVKAEAA
jgi:nucleotide-binding universal stress UspA family protein